MSIHRVSSACLPQTLDESSDLGDRLVTVDVGELSPAEIDTALSRGLVLATAWRDAGLIRAAWLHLQDHERVCLPQPSELNAYTPRGRSANDYRKEFANSSPLSRKPGRKPGARSRPPTRRAAAIAIIANPFSGTYQDDLEELMVVGEETRRPARAALCGSARYRGIGGRELRQGRNGRRER